MPGNRRPERETPDPSLRRDEHDAGNHGRAGRKFKTALRVPEHDAAPLFPGEPDDAAGGGPSLPRMGEGEGFPAKLRHAKGMTGAGEVQRQQSREADERSVSLRLEPWQSP